MNHLPKVFSAAILLLLFAVSLNFAQVPRNNAIAVVSDQEITTVAGLDDGIVTTGAVPKWFLSRLHADTTVEVSHAARWNMLSVPLQAADMHKDTLFPDAISDAYAYDAGYSTETLLERGEGYWMKFASAGANALFGTSVHRDTFAVGSGWNLIGSITDPVSVGSVTTIPPGMSLSVFFGYAGGYEVVSTIEPGQGYWVKVPSAGWLILDGGFLLAKNSPPPDYSAFNRLDIRDAAGRTQSLYFGPAGAAHPGMTTEMPPPPPAGMFDARFTDGNFVEQYSGGDAMDYGVQVTSARYPLTLTWEIVDGESRELRINGSTRMSGRGSITMKEAGPVTITAGAASVPERFSLSQNYPNPFNPVTKIVYELPAGSRVTLTVFDILGREVAVLEDGVQDAGIKTVEFNATGLPSGVYFYRLKAGNFTAVRKLMLMK